MSFAEKNKMKKLKWGGSNSSLTIRRVFGDKFFAMCRWALTLPLFSQFRDFCFKNIAKSTMCKRDLKKGCHVFVPISAWSSYFLPHETRDQTTNQHPNWAEVSLRSVRKAPFLDTPTPFRNTQILQRDLRKFNLHSFLFTQSSLGWVR